MYPILFQLGPFHIYAYGFFIAAGLIAATLLAALKVRKSDVPISFENAAELLFYTVLSALVGSRLLYVLLHLDVFRRDPLQVFKLWEGGLVFYGGLIVAAGVAFGYMKRHRLPVWKLADLISPLIALGLSFGRIGCFLAGCCYGKETSLPWAVVFRNPDSLAQLNVALHPAQLYEAMSGFVLFFLLSRVEKRKSFDGQSFWLFVFLYSVMRFFVEIFRGDPRGFLVTDLLSTSQAIGILLAVFSLFMLFYMKRRSRRENDGDSGNREISSSHLEEKV